MATGKRGKVMGKMVPIVSPSEAEHSFYFDFFSFLFLSLSLLPLPALLFFPLPLFPPLSPPPSSFACVSVSLLPLFPSFPPPLSSLFSTFHFSLLVDIQSVYFDLI